MPRIICFTTRLSPSGNIFAENQIIMKPASLLRTALTLSAACLSAASCFKAESPEGGTLLRVRFGDMTSVSTRNGGSIDTDEYFLTVSGPDGNEIYSGPYKDSPETFNISPGTYTVSAVSCVFSEPMYDIPEYGDTKVVAAASGETVNVTLECQLLNCGMELKADADFRQAFPDASIYLKSDEGSLQYTYGEKRTAYFKPGKITVTMTNGDKTESLFTKVLEKRQVMSVGLSASPGSVGSATGINIQVDTTADHLNEDYTYGEGGDGPENAMGIYEARNSVGSKGVWVYGYVAGCATSTTKVEFGEPFTKNTNIVLGERVSTTDREYCMSVELKSGSIRDALNLVDNPGNKGRKIMLKGDIVSSYFGLPGLKNISEYSF